MPRHWTDLLVLMTKQGPLSANAAHDIAVQALTFVAGDPDVLSRFLGTTGWTAQSLQEEETRETLPRAALEYLMGADDLLLTFAANTGVDPADVARAHYTLQNAPAREGQ